MLHGQKVVTVLPAYRAAETLERTFAEMSAAEKNRISHRGEAVRMFREGLEGFLASAGGGRHG